MHDPKETALRMYIIRGKAGALENARKYISQPNKDIYKLCDWNKVIELLNEMKE